MVPFYKMVHILGFLFRLMCALYSGILFFHLSYLAMRKVGNLCTRPACYYFHGIVRLKLLLARFGGNQAFREPLISYGLSSMSMFSAFPECSYIYKAAAGAF